MKRGGGWAPAAPRPAKGGRAAPTLSNPTSKRSGGFLPTIRPTPRRARRGFVATSLATGFALSVQPVTAQTVIKTDSEGLTAGEVKVSTKDREIPAYRAMPDKGGPFPTVLVVQEVFGVHEHIQDLCRR